jgi:hypothetical protein
MSIAGALRGTRIAGIYAGRQAAFSAIETSIEYAVAKLIHTMFLGGEPFEFDTPDTFKTNLGVNLATGGLGKARRLQVTLELALRTSIDVYRGEGVMMSLGLNLAGTVGSPALVKLGKKLLAKTKLGNLFDYANSMALAVGRRGGGVLSDEMRDAVKKMILKMGYDYDLNADSALDAMTANGNVRTTTRTVKLMLRSDATVGELLHELQHIDHIEEIGISAYHRLKTGTNGNRITEQYVYDKLRNLHWDSLKPAEQARERANILFYGGDAW